MAVRLVGMDKKLFIVQHKMTLEQLSQVQIPEKDFEGMVRNSIYQKTMELLFKTTKVKQYQTEDGFVWEYRMFMYSDREFFTLLKEVLELNEDDRKSMLEDVNKTLGIFE